MIKYGNNDIGRLSFGSNEIGKAYFGNNLVFQKGGGGGGPVLPTGYTVLNYVETPLHTEAYINTGIIATDNTGFEIKAETFDAFGNSGFGCLFGSRAGSNQSDFQLTTYCSSASSGGTLRRGGSSQNYEAHLQANTRFSASLKGNTFKVNNSSTTTSTSISSGEAIYLFALNDNGTAGQFGHVRVYRFKLLNGNTKVLDYVPCRRDSDNLVGFYDLIAESFVAPSSGVLYGIDSTDITYDSTVSYLEFTGAQGVNTGIGVIRNSTRVEIQCQVTDNYSDTQIIVGAGANAGQFFANMVVSNVGRYAVGQQSGQYLSASSEKKTITLSYTNSGTNITDGVDTASQTYIPIVPVRPIQIGRSGADNPYYASVKVWYVKVYEGNTLVRDLIPVEKDNVGCFYDNVTGLLFRSVGATPLIIGTN